MSEPQTDRAALWLTVARAVGAPTHAGLSSGLISALVRRILERRSQPQRRGPLEREIKELLSPLVPTHTTSAADAAGGSLEEMIEQELDVLACSHEIQLVRPSAGRHLTARLGQPLLVPVSADLDLLLGNWECAVPPRWRTASSPRGRFRFIGWGAIGGRPPKDVFAALGIRVEELDAWIGAPAGAEKPDDIIQQLDGSDGPVLTSLDGVKFFDAHSSSRSWRRRVREGVSIDTLPSGVHAARLDRRFDHPIYYAITKRKGVAKALELTGPPEQTRDRWLRLAAATAAAAGQPLEATVEGSSISIYFAPPSWLNRLFAVGEPREDTAGALSTVCFEVAPDLLRRSVELLRRALFVHISNM